MDHPLADRKDLRMEELKQEKFVAMSPAASSSGYYLLVQKAIEANFTPNIIALSDFVPGLMLVACGTGISILYRDLAPQTYDRVVFVPLIGVDPFRRWLMWNKDSNSPIVPKFVQFAKDHRST